jgi:hypothetical protein
MAIQFHCVGCSQPIEVDNEFAGRTAMCPYCRRVVTVPAESTLRELAPAVARPTDAPSGSGLPPPLPPAGLSERPGLPQLQPSGAPPLPPHVGVAPRGTQRPHPLAWASFFCGLALIGLFVVLVGYFVSIAASEYPGGMTATAPAQLSDEEMKAFQKRLMERVQETPVLGIASWGMIVLSVLGVTAGIAALTKRAARNWPAWVGIVVSGVFVACMCGGLLLNLAPH